METAGTDPVEPDELLDGIDLDTLLPLVHARLKAIAAGVRRRSAEDSLNTTALVNEAWLRLAAHRRLELGDRARFFGLCATVMRRVLVDRARARAAAKRPDRSDALSLEALQAKPSGDAAADSLLALDQALGRLQALSPRLAHIVELRVFAGFENAEIGEALGLNEKTVRRDWQKAKALLGEWLEGAA